MVKKDINKHSWRLPYADLGMTIAIAVMVVMVVKSLLFGFTIASIVWISLAFVYILISFICDSHGKVVKTSTTVLLIASVIAIGATLYFDKPTRQDKHIEVELVDTMAIELDMNLMQQDSIKAIPIL